MPNTPWLSEWPAAEMGRARLPRRHAVPALGCLRLRPHLPTYGTAARRACLQLDVPRPGERGICRPPEGRQRFEDAADAGARRRIEEHEQHPKAARRREPLQHAHREVGCGAVGWRILPLRQQRGVHAANDRRKRRLRQRLLEERCVRAHRQPLEVSALRGCVRALQRRPLALKLLIRLGHARRRAAVRHRALGHSGAAGARRCAAVAAALALPLLDKLRRPRRGRQRLVVVDRCLLRRRLGRWRAAAAVAIYATERRKRRLTLGRLLLGRLLLGGLERRAAPALHRLARGAQRGAQLVVVRRHAQPRLVRLDGLAVRVEHRVRVAQPEVALDKVGLQPRRLPRVRLRLTRPLRRRRRHGGRRLRHGACELQVGLRSVAEQQVAARRQAQIKRRCVAAHRFLGRAPLERLVALLLECFRTLLVCEHHGLLPRRKLLRGGRLLRRRRRRRLRRPSCGRWSRALGGGGWRGWQGGGGRIAACGHCRIVRTLCTRGRVRFAPIGSLADARLFSRPPHLHELRLALAEAGDGARRERRVSRARHADELRAQILHRREAAKVFAQLDSQIVLLLREAVSLRPASKQRHQAGAEPQHALLAIKVAQQRQPEGKDLEAVEGGAGKRALAVGEVGLDGADKVDLGV
mmetsp:Transcript_61415/g.168736  ORF Transcript_61415/g.168736 Transcript_61415/m.168736 type:complete len:638 (-) Transcript_61415:544-2457(-)